MTVRYPDVTVNVLEHDNQNEAYLLHLRLSPERTRAKAEALVRDAVADACELRCSELDERTLLLALLFPQKRRIKRLVNRLRASCVDEPPATAM